jgi:hypothetical protein
MDELDQKIMEAVRIKHADTLLKIVTEVEKFCDNSIKVVQRVEQLVKNNRLTKFDEYYWYIPRCPVCDERLGTTGLGFCESRECPNKHYKEQHFHYCSEYFVGDKGFSFDESGYGNDKAEVAMQAQIKKVSQEWLTNKV